MSHWEGDGASGIQWIEGRGGAKHPTLHRVVPQQSTMQPTVSMLRLRKPAQDSTGCLQMDPYLLLKHNPCFPTPSSRDALHSTNSFPHSGSNSRSQPSSVTTSATKPVSLPCSSASFPHSAVCSEHPPYDRGHTSHQIFYREQGHRSYTLRPYRIEGRWTTNRPITNIITHVLHMTTEIIRWSQAERMVGGRALVGWGS